MHERGSGSTALSPGLDMKHPTHVSMDHSLVAPKPRRSGGFDSRVGGAISRPVAPLSSEGRKPTEWGSESPHSQRTDEATDSPDAPRHFVPTRCIVEDHISKLSGLRYSVLSKRPARFQTIYMEEVCRK